MPTSSGRSASVAIQRNDAPVSFSSSASAGVHVMVLVHWIFRRMTPSKVDSLFRKGQLFSAAAFSLGHGGNDAQKTMGIITAVLTAGGVAGLTYGPKGTLPPIPLWVVLSAHARR